MSIAAVRTLRTTWNAKVPLQAGLESAFDEIGFDVPYVNSLITAAKTGLAGRKTKHIKDNVWGMAEFDWSAVRLLDCPVVQRLRGIKQLGLTYLTYPTAEHSRFVHSLGMACVVSRLLTSIESRAAESAEEGPQQDLHYIRLADLSPLKRDDIIHAAILHDIGHMPFSHASEKTLEGLENLFYCGPDSVGDFLGEVESTLRKKVSLSEALSLLVVLSKRFGTFYEGYVRHGSEDPDALLRIAALIAGLPPQPNLTGVSEIISAAAVDADKIDYVNRDAKACGIPVGVDVSRIFLRSGFVRVERQRLISSGLKEDPAPEEIIFVVNASGLDTVDEITQARAALYQRVYLHAVTRTAEAVLSRSLEANATSENKDSNLADALGLWAKSDNLLLETLITANDLRAKKLARHVYNRTLPKKACVFGTSVATMHMPLDQIFGRLTPSDVASAEKQVAHTPLEYLTVKKLAAGRGRRLEDDIKNEVKELTTLLARSGMSDAIPKNPLDLVAIVGTAYMDKPGLDCIVLQNGELVRLSNLTTVREQQDASDIFKAIGYVMCEPEWRSHVLLAARSVLSRPIQGPQSTSITHRNTEQADELFLVQRMILDLQGVIRKSAVKRSNVDALVDAATAAGYFDDKPLMARPVDAGAETVRRIGKRLETFEGQRSWRVRNETVAAFINQFPPRLRDPMLQQLNDLVFFDAAELSGSLLGMIEALRCPVDVVALSPNSGNFVRSKIESEAKGDARFSSVKFCRDLSEALSTSADRPIIFVDDNISSATQARAQFLVWADVPRENWPEECRDEDGIFSVALQKDSLAKLKTRPVYVFVCAGRQKAESKLADVLKTLAFTDFRGIQFKHSIERETKWPEQLRTFLTDVGRSLIGWCKYRKEWPALAPEERSYCDQRAFGFDNAGGLLATCSNVPTSTITALWSPGIYQGSPWMPLLLRQHKLRHFILG